MKINKRPTMLMILDGFGVSSKTHGNAIAQAKKPNFDNIFSQYPGTTLDACGEAVGLPDGQMGNSEVGHLNIGAGRVMYQELSHITHEIQNGNFFNPIPGPIEKGVIPLPCIYWGFFRMAEFTAT